MNWLKATPWRTARLRYLFTIVGGTTPSSDEENWNGPIGWVTPSDLRKVNGQSVSSSQRTVTTTGLTNSGLRLVPAGSVVVSCRAPIGYAATVEVPLTTNQGCKALIPTTDLDPRYFRYQLSAGVSVLESMGRGSTFTEISSQELGDFEVAVPGLEEQRRIADMLDRETGRIDTLITKNDVARGLADERRGELIASAVTKGIRPAGDKTSGLPWASEINTDWTVAPLIAITRTGTGHTPSRSEDSYWIDCDIPWLTTSDVHRLRSGRIERLHDTKENISRVGLDNSAAVLHPAGTVALSRTASVGFSAIMGVDMATSQDFFTWTCGSELRPAFLLYVLRAMKWRGFFDQLMYGSTHKTIYVPDLMSIRTPLPPVEEQDEIVEHIQWESNRIESLDQCLILQSQHLHERREALITAAVTGAIDV